MRLPGALSGAMLSSGHGCNSADHCYGRAELPIGTLQDKGFLAGPELERYNRALAGLPVREVASYKETIGRIRERYVRLFVQRG